LIAFAFSHSLGHKQTRNPFVMERSQSNFLLRV
jgi:hypothetical protein